MECTDKSTALWGRLGNCVLDPILFFRAGYRTPGLDPAQLSMAGTRIPVLDPAQLCRGGSRTSVLDSAQLCRGGSKTPVVDPTQLCREAQGSHIRLSTALQDRTCVLAIASHCQRSLNSSAP